MSNFIIKWLSTLDWEQKFFHPFWLFLHFNLLYNLCTCFSFLYPRPLRFTVFFIKHLLLILLTALLFRPFYDPLLIPRAIWSFNGYSSRDAWTLLVIPISVNICLYFFAFLYKTNKKKLDLVKVYSWFWEFQFALFWEMYLRFAIGLAISWVAIGVFSWYLIRFFTMYGWEATW